MKKNCKVPSFINFVLVTKITSIAFLSYIIINFFVFPYIISLDPIINNLINLIIVTIWVLFVLIYSIIKRLYYIKKIYSLDQHPCEEILREFLKFLAEISSNNSIFNQKEFKKFIKKQFSNKRIDKSTANVLIKNLLKKLRDGREFEIYKKSFKKNFIKK